MKCDGPQVTKKGIMDTQQNPNQPRKPTSPGEGGQQDRDREERERQRREQEKKAAVNRAVNKADDKIGSVRTNERREVAPAASLFTSKRLSKGETILLCRKKKQ